MPSAIDVARLRDLYKTEEFARFFEWASDFINDVSQTTVSRIQAQIGSTHGERPKAALEFCKMLEEAGCGRLVLGRHGKKSRMEWSYTLRSIGAVARGDSRDLEPRDNEAEDDLDDRTSLVTLEIPLRGSKSASIRLPEDFSEADIRKIIEFVRRHFLRQ